MASAAPRPTKLDTFLMSIYNTSTVKHRFEGTQFVDLPYVEMVQETPYTDIVDDPEQSYGVYMDKSNLHWFVLIRKIDSSLPYITLEISTLNMTDLMTVMKVMTQEDCKKLTHIGDYTGKLSTFCMMADRIQETMGRYQLLVSNCQHFCNNLAYQFGLRVQKPTGTFLLNIQALTITEKIPEHLPEKITTDRLPKESHQPQAVDVAYRRTRSIHGQAPEFVRKGAAKAVAILTGVQGYDDMVHQVDNRNEHLV